MGAIVVRSLCDENLPPFILDAIDMEATNALTIKLAVDDCLRRLGDSCDREDVLMFVTDRAPYMKKAGTFSDLNLLLTDSDHVYIFRAPA